MKSFERELQTIARLRPKARAGDSTATFNIAAGYRILGRNALAFRWFRRAAAQGDGGDSELEVGYCHHHGVGVRRDAALAERAYRSAIASARITPFGREEAMYHLAILLLSKPRTAARRSKAIELLRDANKDGDYPQAELLAACIDAPEQVFCTCRRGLRAGLRRRHCNLHRDVPKRRESLARNTRARSR
jgi:TPR repeat protein